MTMAEGVPFNWDNANFTWDNNPYTWDEVELVEELADASGGGYEEILGKQEKKKRFIKLLCKVKGKEYATLAVISVNSVSGISNYFCWNTRYPTSLWIYIYSCRQGWRDLINTVFNSVFWI